MEKRIIINISPNGKIIAETENMKGKQCLDYINILESLLDAETIDSDYTEEYYETELTTEISVNKIKERRDE